MPALGTLRERVELMRKDQIIEGAGGHADSYVSIGTVWARVRSLKGALSAFGDGRNAKISHMIVMRFRDDLKPGDRVIYRTREFEILSADDLNGRRAYLSCRCAEINPTG
jgi:SPP1 family predicted phage head-tail adaptor